MREREGGSVGMFGVFSRSSVPTPCSSWGGYSDEAKNALLARPVTAVQQTLFFLALPAGTEAERFSPSIYPDLYVEVDSIILRWAEGERLITNELADFCLPLVSGCPVFFCFVSFLCCCDWYSPVW